MAAFPSTISDVTFFTVVLIYTDLYSLVIFYHCVMGWVKCFFTQRICYGSLIITVIIADCERGRGYPIEKL